MKLDEFLMFEVTGLTNTIKEYTRDHYVIGYADILLESSEKKDYEKIEGCMKRLLVWYKENIEVIKEDKFLYNKDQHEKSISFLERAIKQVEKLNT